MAQIQIFIRILYNCHYSQIQNLLPPILFTIMYYLNFLIVGDKDIYLNNYIMYIYKGLYLSIFVELFHER